jgi:hypothetical protein
MMQRLKPSETSGPTAAEMRTLARLRRRARELFGSGEEGDRMMLLVLAACPRPCPEERMVAELEELALRRRPAH